MDMQYTDFREETDKVESDTGWLVIKTELWTDSRLQKNKEDKQVNKCANKLTHNLVGLMNFNEI